MITRSPITQKQKEVLDFIKSFTKKRGFGPSLKEVQEALGFTSHSTAQFHINQLVEKGFLKKTPGISRSIEPLKVEEVVELPILGTVAAGGPIEAVQEENPEIREIPKSMLKGNFNRHYLLRVRGDSMIEKHILPGDLVLIREQTDFDNHDVVVIADEDWQATLKEVLKDKQRVTLKPANKKYQIYTMELGSCQVIGKMIGLMRETED